MTNKILFLSTIVLFFIKLLSIYYTNFNLFGDEAQYWLWSKDLDFGYYSKPPLLSWFIWFFTSVLGDSFFSLKLIPSIVYLLVAFVVYDLCRNINLNKKDAICASLLFLLMPAVSFSSFILSTDIFLLLFWSLSLGLLFKIKKSPNILNFFFLGIVVGLGFLSKYAMIYFVLCLIVYIFFDAKFRTLIKENYLKLAVTIICMLIIIFPNIYWNFSNGWVTLEHTSDNANFKNIEIDLLRGAYFLIIQALMVGPFLFLAAVLNYRLIEIDHDKKILLFFSLPIFIIVLIEAVIVRANANWAAPALISFFLFLYISIANIKTIYFKLNIFFNITFCVIFFSLIGISYKSIIFDRISGMTNYSNYVLNQGNKSNINKYVVSDRLLFASLSYELRNYDIGFYMPHKKNDKITNHFKISSPLKKDIKENFIFIGYPEEIKYLENSFTINKVDFAIEKNIGDNFVFEVYEVVFN